MKSFRKKQTARWCLALLVAVPAGFAAENQPSSAPSIHEPIGREAFRVLNTFYDYDSQIPLDPRVVERKESDTTVRWKVVFRSARSFLVPGLLEFPKKARPPYPCVLLMHGWSGSKEGWWEKGNYVCGGELREALLDKGCAVLALDAQGHGDRIAENDYNVVNLYNEPSTTARKNYFTLREIITQTVIDYRRGLDYLAARGDIDMNRVGLLGYSMGGFQAFALTAVEPRIKLGVSCVVPVSWSQDVVLAPVNYACGIGDRPFCMLMGRDDTMCNEAQARQLYSLIERPNTQLLLYAAGHKLPPAYVQDAVAFIASRL
jgi:dienelactone hydrolase